MYDGVSPPKSICSCGLSPPEAFLIASSFITKVLPVKSTGVDNVAVTMPCLNTVSVITDAAYTVVRKGEPARVLVSMS